MILLIEDEVDILNNLKDILEQNNYQVLRAKSIKEGKEYLDKNLDLIIFCSAEYRGRRPNLFQFCHEFLERITALLEVLENAVACGRRRENAAFAMRRYFCGKADCLLKVWGEVNALFFVEVRGAYHLVDTFSRGFHADDIDAAF